jgi:hypothetical protein
MAEHGAETEHGVVTVDAVAVGLALGAFLGAVVLLMGLVAWLTGTWTAFVNGVGLLYLGYGPTPVGSAVGAVWGAIDGFVAGAAVAWLYNRIAERRAGSAGR